MESMNISLPDGLKAFVDARVRNGGYSSVSEYVRELVREDQKRLAQEQLEVLLREAVGTGPGRALSKADWEALRREFAERLTKRSKR